MKSLSLKLKLAALAAISAVALCSRAQDPSQETTQGPDTGLVEIESFQGTMNAGERLFKLDSKVGWDFSKRFGIFAGLPVYFVHIPSSTVTAGGVTTTTPAANNNGIGNAYVGLAFRAPNPALDYESTLTAGGPTGSTSSGLSSGRGTFDWDNRFEHSFGSFTPFFDGGLANTVPDSTLFTRPFTSLGLAAHLEEGAEFAPLVKHVGIGGSVYEILPAGNQKVFSRLVKRGGTAVGAGKHHRVFETAASASGNGLTRENGFSTWIGFDPSPLLRFEVGYTRSMTFDLNEFAFNFSVNLGKMLRSKRPS